MKTIRRAIVLALTAASLFPCLSASALPKEPNYPCYMRTTSRKLIDLTAWLCPFKPVSQVPSVSEVATAQSGRSDSLFTREYKKRAALVENVATAKLLIQIASQNPASVTSAAASVCTLATGEVSEDYVQRAMVSSLPTDSQDPVRHMAGVQEIHILYTMAHDGYCSSSL